jgi:hypothetical protein
MRRWLAEHAAVLAIAAVYATLTLTHFEPAFRFHGDHERDLRYATLLVEHGVWPDASPAIAPTPFELGPLLYLVLAPAIAISADPVVVRGYFVALTVLALFVLHRLLRRHVSRTAAGVALFALASSEFVYEASAQLWHSSLLALPLAGFWLAVDTLVRAPTRRALVAAAILAGLAIQLHITAVGYSAILAAAALGPARRALGVRTLLVGVAAFLAALTPFWVTLTTTISRGALAHASGSAHGWSPAPLGELASFCFDNVHPIWGDDLGPLLVWPLLACFAVGVVAATRTWFGRLLISNLAIGLVEEWLLLGNQRAHRYLYANAWAFFLVVGLGVEPLLTRVATRARPWLSAALAALALAVTVEACVSEVPRADTTGWFNAVEQRAVASVMAERFPMTEDAMETHVHGLYFGEPMGMHHWHLILGPPEPPPDAPAAATAAPSRGPHVLVMPTDLGLAPFGDPVGPRYTVKADGRDVLIQAFNPAFTALEIDGPAGEELHRRWRRPHASPRGPARHTLRVTATRAGTATLALADGRTGDHCPVHVTVNGTPAAAAPIETPAYTWIRFIRIAVPDGGAVAITLGPCRAPAFVDLF